MTKPAAPSKDIERTAALLEAELAACHDALGVCMEAILDPDRFFDTRRNTMLIAAKLMGASAQLAKALAALKGETHQRIIVERPARARGEGSKK